MHNDQQRWAHLFRRLTAPIADGTHAPDAAAALMLQGYRPNTQRSYMSKFRFFLTYCSDHGRAPLPADPCTIVGYILWE